MDRPDDDTQEPFSEDAPGGSGGKPPLFLFMAVFSTTGFQVPPPQLLPQRLNAACT